MSFTGRDSGRQQLTTPTSIEFSQLPSLGKSLRYAREDHSHGMTADSVVAHVADADPHGQYALLAGRASGQTLKGGTAASEDLTLVSTAHATKGDVYIGGDGTTHRSVFELDGTLRFDGDATVWDDIQFGISSGRVSAANFPDWDTFTTNSSEYSFDVNDYIDLGAVEMPHWWKEGTVIYPHLHVTTKAANATGADRFAKFQVVLAYAEADAVWAETTIGGEITIPDGTAALTHLKLSLDSVDLAGVTINTQVKSRIKRIAATGGTEYADHIFITQLGLHAEKDTVGSREITTK